jgi:hypothetical protein
LKTSLASLLSRDIETFATRLRSSHPLLSLALRGEFPPAGVAFYLMNVRFLVEQTPRHMETARRRATELGEPELAELFGKKLVEETGHDVWASNDLRKLKDIFAVEAVGEPSSHLQDLIHSLDRTIGECPSRYLAYTLFVEYLMVLIGPIWISALSEGCGVPIEALSVIQNHVELDIAHVSEELRDIDALLSAEESPAHIDTLHSSMRHFELFCDELFLRFGSVENAAVAAE